MPPGKVESIQRGLNGYEEGDYKAQQSLTRVGPTVSKRKNRVKYDSGQRSKFSLKCHKGEFYLIFTISLRI